MKPGLWLTIAACLAGCGRTPARVDEPVDAGVEADVDAGPEPITESDKLDVLFVIDNSVTAALMHETLSRTIPYFLDRLVNPRCTNGLGQIVDNPAPGEPCAVGLRDFAPAADVHVGIVSSSLGGHGGDSCSPAALNFHPHQNDAANLLSRNAAGGVVPTYDGLGYLTWDPAQKYSPPGDDDIDGFGGKLSELIEGVGDNGCGFEATLESFYRFLIDPNPYEDILINGDTAEPVGTDKPLLEQRKAFLRPDSVVLIVVVSDEDDCSTRDGGQFWYSMQGGTYHLPRPRSECAVDPDDPCCASCGQAPPSGCPDDAACTADPLNETEDPLSLRCFDQKHRFGIDFLNPVDRYVDALTETEVADREGNVVDNPLFIGGRSPDLVLLAGILGVPWQDIANAPTNLGAGFIPGPDIPWRRILAEGDTPPEDPLMIPSREARSGEHPVTGDALAPPTATSALENPINGHEHALATEIQYACIYPLETPIDCTDGSCECTSPMEWDTNPICQDENGVYGGTQYFARAQPATRQLRVLELLGPRGTVASICTEPVFNEQQPDFGYKPSVDALMRALHHRLK